MVGYIAGIVVIASILVACLAIIAYCTVHILRHGDAMQRQGLAGLAMAAIGFALVVSFAAMLG